ncbi:MAG: calcium-binding protein [Aestuariivirga sp.]
MTTRIWGTEQIVNSGRPGAQLNSNTAALADGGFVVVWQDDTTADSAIRAQRFSAAGVKTGAEIAIATPTGSDATFASVTGLANGGFLVSWTEAGTTENSILGAVYNANGVFVRNQNSILSSGLDTGSSAALLDTGSVVAWADPESNNGDILFRIFGASGTGGAILTANSDTTGAQIDPVVAAAPDASKFVVVWGGADVFVRGRVFGPSGAQFAAEFDIAAPGLREDPDPVVAWLNNGEFAVAWHETGNAAFGGNIKVKIFNGQTATVVPLTGDIVVNSVSLDSQQDPQITALPGGGFVVSWEDHSGTGGDPGAAIKLQAFDAAGGKVGNELLVNTTTSGDQLKPSITALSDGRVAVSWTDFSSGNADVRVQVVDPRGGFVTGTTAGEVLYGHDLFSDEIWSFAGNDVVYGLSGDDVLRGGDGFDVISGGIGDDTLLGDADNDTLYGGSGDDELLGGDGNDVLRGGPGADILNGGAGRADMADYLTSKTGVVAIIGGLSLDFTGSESEGDQLIGIERLRGSKFGDQLVGDDGANLIFGEGGGGGIFGNGGNDRLYGGEDLEGVYGGDGDDLIVGGMGRDELSGGAGKDRFVYSNRNDRGDIFVDFTSADDTLEISRTFGGGLVAGALSAGQFQTSADNVASTATVRFIYDTTRSWLWFDIDGTGATPNILVAQLQDGAAFSIDDILII